MKLFGFTKRNAYRSEADTEWVDGVFEEPSYPSVSKPVTGKRSAPTVTAHRVPLATRLEQVQKDLDDLKANLVDLTQFT